MAAVECPQCGTKYNIHLPDSSYIIALFDNIEVLIQRGSPMLLGGVVVGSVYWTSVTYGAVTLMQTLGQNTSLIVMERRGNHKLNEISMVCLELNKYFDCRTVKFI